MNMNTQLSLIDRIIINADQALKTLSPGATKAERTSPAQEISDSRLTDKQQQHIAGLMRINHAGEVCAQALYQGQSLTAKLSTVREAMDQAAREEIDHLAWCEERIQQLNSRTSLLNPVWYAMSFALGAAAGAIGDQLSLGFVAATEEQVCKHLSEHLNQLPDEDEKTRAILREMLKDEARHAEKALAEGGMQFPAAIKNLMTLVSRVMTKTSYQL
jgi:ubiquinone biosynthesis monooxygenase Coq7